jgi:hypothetical protein
MRTLNECGRDAYKTPLDRRQGTEIPAESDVIQVVSPVGNSSPVHKSKRQRLAEAFIVYSQSPYAAN